MHEAGDISPEEMREQLNREALAAARHRAALGRLLGLGESEVLAIQHLGRVGQLTPGQLAALLRLSTGGATALIQRLERAGHVRRQPHPRDGRSTILRLTPDIERQVAQAFEPLVAELDRAAAELSAEQRRVVAHFLERVADARERQADALARSADVREESRYGVPVPGLWG